MAHTPGRRQRAARRSGADRRRRARCATRRPATARGCEWAAAIMERVWRDYRDETAAGCSIPRAAGTARGLLPARAKPVQDTPTPSPNGVAGIVRGAAARAHRRRAAGASAARSCSGRSPGRRERAGAARGHLPAARWTGTQGERTHLVDRRPGGRPGGRARCTALALAALRAAAGDPAAHPGRRRARPPAAPRSRAWWRRGRRRARLRLRRHDRAARRPIRSRTWHATLAAARRRSRVRLGRSPAYLRPRTRVAKTATIDTSKGTIEAELFDTEVPDTVANFEKLANSEFYDGTRFHRVIANFMVQGGDPLSQGAEQSPGRHRRPGLQDQVRDPSQHPQARRRHPLDGARRQGHRRQPVLHLPFAAAAPRPGAHRLRPGDATGWTW